MSFVDNCWSAPSTDDHAVILGSVFTLLFESAVLGLTWAKTADTVYVFKHKPENENTASYLLLRDGKPISNIQNKSIHVIPTVRNYVFCVSRSSDICASDH